MTATKNKMQKEGGIKMRNMDKFIEVFGEETFNDYVERLGKGEITIDDILLWFLKEYGEKPEPKKRGRKPKQQEN